MALREIFPITETEATSLDRLPEREGCAWDLWKLIGKRLNLDFNPAQGKVAYIERVGHLAFRVTWHPRRIRSQHVEVGR